MARQQHTAHCRHSHRLLLGAAIVCDLTAAPTCCGCIGALLSSRCARLHCKKFALLCRNLFLTIASCPQQSSHTFYSASACACMHARVNARIITFNMYVKQRCSRSPFNQQLLLLLPPPRPPLQKHRPQDTPRLDAVQSRAWLPYVASFFTCAPPHLHGRHTALSTHACNHMQ